MRYNDIAESARPRAAILPLTKQNVTKVKKFVMRKWVERAKEDLQWLKKWHDNEVADWKEPDDLSNGCKFSSLFCATIFGGRVVGNYDHYFVLLPNGEKFDLNEDARDVQEMLKAFTEKRGLDPYRIDEPFMSLALRTDKLNVGNRVSKWVNEFCAQEGLPHRFKRTSAGNLASLK